MKNFSEIKNWALDKLVSEDLDKETLFLYITCWLIVDENEPNIVLTKKRLKEQRESLKRRLRYENTQEDINLIQNFIDVCEAFLNFISS